MRSFLIGAIFLALLSCKTIEADNALRAGATSPAISQIVNAITGDDFSTFSTLLSQIAGDSDQLNYAFSVILRNPKINPEFLSTIKGYSPDINGQINSDKIPYLDLQPTTAACLAADNYQIYRFSSDLESELTRSGIGASDQAIQTLEKHRCFDVGNQDYEHMESSWASNKIAFQCSGDAADDKERLQCPNDWEYFSTEKTSTHSAIWGCSISNVNAWENVQIPQATTTKLADHCKNNSGHFLSLPTPGNSGYYCFFEANSNHLQGNYCAASDIKIVAPNNTLDEADPIFLSFMDLGETFDVYACHTTLDPKIFVDAQEGGNNNQSTEPNSKVTTLYNQYIEKKETAENYLQTLNDEGINWKQNCGGIPLTDYITSYLEAAISLIELPDSINDLSYAEYWNRSMNKNEISNTLKTTGIVSPAFKPTQFHTVQWLPDDSMIGAIQWKASKNCSDAEVQTIIFRLISKFQKSLKKANPNAIGIDGTRSFSCEVNSIIAKTWNAESKKMFDTKGRQPTSTLSFQALKATLTPPPPTP